jgi:ribonuclease BN (tRNA processing enzyme)
MPVPINDSFYWEDIIFTPVQTVHIMSGYKITNSYGLMIQKCKEIRWGLRAGPISIPKAGIQVDPSTLNGPAYQVVSGVGPKVFFTTDTQFCPNQITKFYNSASTIFHDCETAPYYSKVHAHYDDLKTLPPDVKKKMWLYHYQPNPKQDAKADGFLGFVTRGQEFEIKEKL